MARRWKLLTAAAVTGMIVAWLLSALQPDRYRATLLAAVAPHGETMNTTDVLRGLEVLEQRTVVATVAALATTPAATEAAIQSDRGYTIDASVLPNTNLVRIEVEGADAGRAAAIANRIPPVLSRHARSMFKFYSVTPVSAALPPTEPISSGSVRTILAGLLIGLVIGAAIAIAIEKFRPSNTLVRA
jgi:capsular polysaccharide biosynthesis protein